MDALVPEENPKRWMENGERVESTAGQIKSAIGLTHVTDWLVSNSARAGSVAVSRCRRATGNVIEGSSVTRLA